MSTKIFVHHPLKRAELKRLAAPPPPPSIPAKIRPPEPDYVEKARRAAARAQARFEEEHRIAKFKDDIDLVKSVFKTIWIDSYHFCDWMKKLFDEDPTLYDKIMSDQPDCTLVDMFCPGVGKLCLYCNERAIKHAGHGWAGFMMSTIDITKDNEILSYVLCNRCAKLSYKALIHKSAEIMVRKVRQGDDNKLIRKSTLQPLDLQYIGDNMPILISRHRSETVGFLKRLRDSDLIVNPEVLDEFA